MASPNTVSRKLKIFTSKEATRQKTWFLPGVSSALEFLSGLPKIVKRGFREAKMTLFALRDSCPSKCTSICAEV